MPVHRILAFCAKENSPLLHQLGFRDEIVTTESSAQFLYCLEHDPKISLMIIDCSRATNADFLLSPEYHPILTGSQCPIIIFLSSRLKDLAKALESTLVTVACEPFNLAKINEILTR